MSHIGNSAALLLLVGAIGSGCAPKNNEIASGTSAITLPSRSSTDQMIGLHEELLATGYQDRDCLDVAYAVAESLLAEGASPEIAFFYAKDRGYLQPVQFGGEVSWLKHAAVVADGQVYDPLLKVPVTEANYGALAFGKEIFRDVVEYPASYLKVRYQSGE